MNNNHNQSRRSSSFNRHNNISGRTNHSHAHPRWPNRFTKDYGREYENNNFRGYVFNLLMDCNN